MRVFCATLSHETNRYSPLPTNLESYREFYLFLPSTREGAHYLDAPMEGVNLYAALKRRGHDVVCGLAASAQPSMPTRRDVYEFLRDEMISALQSGGRFDAVALFLHGAQVAEGFEDCAGDVLARIRSMVGFDVPVGVLLDLHANISDAMAEHADILLPCKEYPHFDFENRAEQLIDLLEATAEGRVRPAMRVTRVPMTGTYFTTAEPMRGFVDALYEMERRGEVLNASVCHGFAPADVEYAGAATISITNGEPERAVQVADGLAARLFSLRDAIAPPFRSLVETLDEAQGAAERPVVIADATDNPGGGASGDSTFILRAMLGRRMEDAALAMIWDPEAATLASRAGEGAILPLRLGGKCGPTSGAPLDVTARVLRVRDDGFQMGQGMRCPFGLAAAVAVDGVEVVINSVRNQTFTPECFTAFGIDPKAKRYLVVKSQQHFHEHFAKFAGKIIYAKAPGTVEQASARYRNVGRPNWPIDTPPFRRFGREWA
ncbi:MAG TPA: M81 family metallopeptidase [Caulobacteraceae bacterium]|nr:M81 family metallopeptidase [Caulobacteraceae bacterium]